MKTLYKKRLASIFEQVGRENCFVQSIFEKAIETENFYSCYIDKQTRKIEKYLLELVNDYLEDFPKSVKPVYKHHFYVSPY